MSTTEAATSKAVVVLATFRVHHDAMPRARRLAQEMTERTADDPGCLEFGFSEPLGTGDRLQAVERWAGQAELDAHLGRPHTAAFLRQMTPLTAEPPVVTLYEVASSRRLG